MMSHIVGLTLNPERHMQLAVQPVHLGYTGCTTTQHKVLKQSADAGVNALSTHKTIVEAKHRAQSNTQCQTVWHRVLGPAGSDTTLHYCQLWNMLDPGGCPGRDAGVQGWRAAGTGCGAMHVQCRCRDACAVV
jgi:hypothetical protein